MTGIVTEIVLGSAVDFHARPLPTDPHPHIWWFTPNQSALVLGSTQNLSIVDSTECRKRGIEIVKRRSGGGAVLLSSETTVWIDVVLPATHELSVSDIGQAPLWLGKLFQQVLTDLGVADLTLHETAMEKSDWSTLICFAGRGPGEVFTSNGRKVVGISQRRTREWVRFQIVVSLAWRPEILLALLNVPKPNLEDIFHCGSDISLDAHLVGQALFDALEERLSIKGQ
jgi:lipoate---protein ligase